MLNHNDLLELLNYDETTGIFTWKKSRRGVKINIPLGCSNGFGYLRITVLNKSYYAHRLAWFYVHKKMPTYEIDHINGLKNDNRICNLRELTRQGNSQNKLKSQSNSKSNILGVSWNKKAKKWAAHICIYKERKYLGLFKNIEEAQDAYLKEKEKINYECL